MDDLGEGLGDRIGGLGSCAIATVLALLALVAVPVVLVG